MEIQVVGLVMYDAARRLGLARWILGTIFVCAMLGTAHALATESPNGLTRFAGLYGNPNMLAIVCILGLSVFSAGIARSARRWIQVVAYLAAVATLAGVVASASLKGALGTILLVLQGLLWRDSRKRVGALVAVAVGAAAVLSATIESFRSAWDLALYRISVVLSNLGVAVGDNESFVERARFIRKGLALMAESPIWGRGLESFRWLSGESAYAHNNFVEIGVSLGLVGLILYYALPLGVLFAALRDRGRDPVVRRFAIIALPTLLVLDMAYVSYTTKVVALTTIMLAGWVDGANDLRAARDARAESG
jgi:O-antigen ligase